MRPLLFPHEVREGGAQGICDEEQVVQACRLDCGLDPHDRGAVQIGMLGELLLGPPAVETRLPDLVSDPPAACKHPRWDRI